MNVFNPTLSRHRELMEYDDNDIDVFWKQGSKFFYEFAGVDFREIPVSDIYEPSLVNT